MNTRALRTAAQCTEHGKRTYACVNCARSVTRKACETWHQELCDDCITLWAYDKTVRDADKAITDGAHHSTIAYLTRCAEDWKQTALERGLLKR